MLPNNKLNGEARNMVQRPDAKERFRAAGIELMASSPEAFAERIRLELPRWRKLMRKNRHPAETICLP